MNVAGLHENLYRMGRSSDPNFGERRALVDCMTADRNGTKVVIANGNGFSAFTFITPKNARLKRKGLEVTKGNALARRHLLVRDLRQGHKGHYMLAPAYDMPFAKYLGLMEEIALNSAYAQKLTIQEIETCPTSPR